MSGAMDMYFSSDSVSLQEMLDIDIKSEIDVLVGGQSDLSGFNFADLPPLELDDASDIRWFSSTSNLSNSSFSLDLSNDDATTMVNPNTVMPFGSTISLAQSIRSPSPTIKESHLTFSPSTIKVGNVKSEAISVKKDLLNKLSDLEAKKSGVKIAKMASIIAKPVDKQISNIKSNPTIISFKNAVHQHLIAPVNIAQISTISNMRTINARKQANHHSLLIDTDRAYPKPAYSYSCLIAMALKNSRAGCLPVSEIYNFMCRHFPYFKTAPNGWKNSVRHNLSLNKCFEKIEKPAINGAQRKGCLWAMNPAKINKMDEEVLKWSRKDPSAIKKAMVNPEQLERLERGQMKFTYDDADNFGSAESEEGSESEPDVEQEAERRFNGERKFFNVTDTTMGDQMDVEEGEGEGNLIVEMALAQKELLEYDRCVSNKKRKIFLVQE